MRILIFLILVAVTCFTSCVPQKQTSYNYLENLHDTTGPETVQNFEPVIQQNDLLSIHVYSLSTKPEISDALYNPPAIVGLANGSSGSNGTSGGTGYLVDRDGNIKFPRIGVVHAQGLTKRQLEDTLASKITELDSPTVIVRFMNYRVTVLGEVGHQGTFTLPYEKVTIFEAVGLAGDIPVTGKKNTVRVLREANGVRQIGTIDLTASNVFESPFYFLQQNDVVFVEVKKSKVKQTDQALVTQRITFALGLVTSIALLYNIFK